MLASMYLLLFLFLVFVLIYWFRRGMRSSDLDNKTIQKYTLIGVGCISLWVLFQYGLSLTGFYQNMSLPPRLPLAMIIPLVLFSIIFLVRNKKSKILKNIPIHVPIAYQSFRAAIEVLFYFTFMKGLLPEQVTFAGANFDVLIGITAVFMAFYAARPHASKKILLLWNYVGIAVVGFAAFTFVSSFYFPSFWGENARISKEFGQFPYLLLPAFIMPSAIFVHIFSILQLTGYESIVDNS